MLYLLTVTTFPKIVIIIQVRTHGLRAFILIDTDDRFGVPSIRTGVHE